MAVIAVGAAPAPVLTIHRSAHQIGGNCIEIAYDRHRVLLDAGMPLEHDAAKNGFPIPETLDRERPVDAVLISHPHQDHYGLLPGLPAEWPVWSGRATEVLMQMTSAISARKLPQPFRSYESFKPFRVGPFRITPYLTDHSAFDAHMLLIEVGGRKILYSGDFRTIGRKAVLVERLMERPPRDVDVLLLEGTTLGRKEEFPTERDLEDRFVDLFGSAKGRVFATWSAQNIDRTVTLYRACKKAKRDLVVDLYAADVLSRLGEWNPRLPQPGWPGLKVVVTYRMQWLYRNPKRLNRPEFVDGVCSAGHAIGAGALATNRSSVVMLRSSLIADFEKKGVSIGPEDTWVFSMWKGYHGGPDYADIRERFARAGSPFHHIHTSGHASQPALERFAKRIAPRHLVPIHSFQWDRFVDRFENVKRLDDGEAFEVPRHGRS